MKTKLPLKLTISRPQCSDGRKYISINITDGVSGIQFLDAEIELADFAEALTGFSCTPMKGDLRGLEHIGKTRVTEKREIVCPLRCYDRAELAAWLGDNAQEDGWIVNTYLGSQGAVRSHASGGQTLRYSVTKYVDPAEVPTEK